MKVLIVFYSTYGHLYKMAGIVEAEYGKSNFPLDNLVLSIEIGPQ